MLRNLLKFHIPQWRAKEKSDPESTSGFGSTSQFKHFQRVNLCPCIPCLVDICKCTRELSGSHTERAWVIRLTDRACVSYPAHRQSAWVIRLTHRARVSYPAHRQSARELSGSQTERMSYPAHRQSARELSGSQTERAWVIRLTERARVSYPAHRQTQRTNGRQTAIMATLPLWQTAKTNPIPLLSNNHCVIKCANFWQYRKTRRALGGARVPPTKVFRRLSE